MISICRILIDDKSLPKHFKFIQISTDEVYGSLNKSDQNLLTWIHQILIVPLRLHDVFYWKNSLYPEKLIPLAFSKINKNDKVPIYGDGLQIRDWIHVDDHVQEF